MLNAHAIRGRVWACMPGAIDHVSGTRDIRVHRQVHLIRMDIPSYYRLDTQRIDHRHSDAIEGRSSIRQVLWNLEATTRDAVYRPIERLWDFKSIERLRDTVVVEVNLPCIGAGGKRAIYRIGGCAAKRDSVSPVIRRVECRCRDRRGWRSMADDDLRGRSAGLGAIAHRQRRRICPVGRIVM